MRSLVIGLGRSGAGLHLPVLRRLRATAEHSPFTAAPVVGCDPAGPDGAAEATEPVWTGSVDQAARLLDPEDTVAHVCTPPTVRLPVLTDLARHGFRNIIVEKPLAANEADLDEILRLRARRGLRLAVVAPWLTSELTRRLGTLVADARLGRLRSVSVVQNKPRFRRSLATTGHPTAFDVELPHAVGVVLSLAGPAEITAASCADLVLADRRVPRLGGAGLRLRHAGGVRTHLMSNLAAPVRERRITLRFDHGTAIGNYAIGADDDHAQLMVAAGGRHEHNVFQDDSLGAYLLDAYRGFAGPGEVRPADFELAVDVVRLLAAAKDRPEITPERPLVASHVD
ncbi:Gfo/Idh/MocA family oxidoreductase [Actinophytocola sediminis]